MAHFLNARGRLAADVVVSVLRVHRLHVLRNYFVLALLAVHERSIASSMTAAPALSVQAVLVGSRSLPRRLHLDRAHRRGARPDILAVKTAVKLHLLVLRARRSTQIHIIQADLTLMRLAASASLPKIIILLRA